jgi:GTP-binding protein EngB required for normal cell division
MQNKTDKIKQHKETKDAKQTNKQTNKIQAWKVVCTCDPSPGEAKTSRSLPTWITPEQLQSRTPASE